jgi:alpha-D-xyloside xylohydrolase
VYAGADGKFTLYEDDGLTYKYEGGSFARVPISWNDATQTLTLGPRSGSFPGMVSARTFKVVIVSPGHPTGFSFSPTPVATIQYNGTAVETKLMP